MIRLIAATSLRFLSPARNLKLQSRKEVLAFSNCFSTVKAIPQNEVKEEHFQNDNESPPERLKRLVREADIDTGPVEAEETDIVSNKELSEEPERAKKPTDKVNQGEPGESITSRLRRLSTSSVEDFVPSPEAKAARQKVKSRYHQLEESYTSRYPQRDDGFNNNRRRYYSTKATQSSVDEADTFGTIGLRSESDVFNNRANFADEQSLFDDERDDIRFKPDEKWTMRGLTIKIRQLANDQKIKEAIETLTTAHREGGFDYDNYDMAYLYSIVISACARVGYVKMCFKLFAEMKKRGLKPRLGLYTSLFNACANSPWDAEENIKRINRLRLTMDDKGLLPNLVNCNAMIKAYGRCGDVQSAFAVVDEIKKRERLTTETFNFLLQACISDTENGFRHMIFTWQKMKSQNLRADIYTYNLILRAVRECGIKYLGPSSSSPSLKKASKENESLPVKRLTPIVNLEDTNTMVELIANNSRGDFTNESAISAMPNENILEILNVVPENRLAVFGGFRGFLKLMKMDDVYPNIKTMMELVQIINPDEFYDLMARLEELKIEPDISFFNLMIKRHQYYQQKKSSLNVLQTITNYHLTPNIMTWGVLSLGCDTWNSAKSLLQEMDDAKFVPNLIIMETLLTQAIENYDPLYVNHMMEELKYREVKPNNNFVIKLQNFRDTVQKGLVRKERGKEVIPRLAAAMEANQNFEEHFVHFKLRYNPWLKRTEVVNAPKDPWEADFKERYPQRKPKIYAKDIDEQLSSHYNE